MSRGQSAATLRSSLLSLDTVSTQFTSPSPFPTLTQVSGSQAHDKKSVNVMSHWRSFRATCGLRFGCIRVGFRTNQLLIESLTCHILCTQRHTDHPDIFTAGFKAYPAECVLMIDFLFFSFQCSCGPGSALSSAPSSPILPSRSSELPDECSHRSSQPRHKRDHPWA